MLNALLLLPGLWANQKMAHVRQHLIGLSLCLFLVPSANHTRTAHLYRVIASQDGRSHQELTPAHTHCADVGPDSISQAPDVST